MGGLTRAVHWWEESQLRVLVLTSMVVQVLLLFFSSLRRFAIPGWVRSITWLAYLGGDAVAIYALATLFNRHKDQCGGGGSNVSTLEVMWAPVLLLHLGGQDNITAYNIEDNELWSRHVVTAVSQVTVAVYVFCKSWPPDGDKRLLLAGILLFIPGVLKCFLKAWALKSASIYSLVRPSAAATARQNGDEDMYPLQEYVEHAKEFVHGNKNVVDDVATPASASVKGDGFWAQYRRALASVKGDGFWAQRRRALLTAVHQRRQRIRQRLQQLGKLVPSGEEDKGHSLSQGQGRFCAQLIEQHRQLWNEREEARKRLLVLGEASDKLFVDLSSPSPLRLRILKYFWGISQDTAYDHAQGGLVAAFLLLYTRLKTAGFVTYGEMALGLPWEFLRISFRLLIFVTRLVLPLVSIGLFHRSHHIEEARNDIIDVKFTYAIFCCTAVLEFFAAMPISFWDLDNVYLSQERVVKWPEMVAQYSFMGYFASNKKHSNWMRIAGIFGCKDFVHQRILCMKPCSSSARITQLVLGYLKDGWKKEIHDAPSYCRFNDHNTHWPVLLGYLEDCHHVGLRSSSMGKRKRAFDESVLLWHIATDICFFWSPRISKHRCQFAEVQTWKTSLLEFLGVRRTRTNEQRHRCRQELTPCRAVQCRQMSNYMAYLLFVDPEMLLPGTRRNLLTDAYNGINHILNDMDMDMDIPMRNKWNRNKDGWVVKRVIKTMWKRNRSKEEASEPCSEEEPKKVSPSEEKSNKNKGAKLIDKAWALAQRLLDNNKGDEKKMWEEIQRVWVEMLCFSASRCRGYLHAKALGEGGEFLSYVWLTLFHMGMETFTDKLHREEPPSVPHEGNRDDGNATPPSAAPPSTCCKVSTGIATPSISEVHAATGAVPSTSEICCVDEDDMV